MISRPQSNQPMPTHATLMFQGIIFDTYQWQQELFDGSFATFEKLKRADSVAVVPILPGNALLMIEDEQPARPCIITFPGGQIEEGEDPETAACRELLEETGYAAGELVLWKAFQPDTKIDWAIYVFIAKNCVKTAELHLDPGERIQQKIVTLEEAVALARQANFRSSVNEEFIHASYSAEVYQQLSSQLFT